MTTTLTDPRTEAVLRAADDVDHIFCGDCWTPGMPMMCGEPDSGGPECTEDCTHPRCSMCEVEWERHCQRKHGPRRRRWLP